MPSVSHIERHINVFVFQLRYFFLSLSLWLAVVRICQRFFSVGMWFCQLLYAICMHVTPVFSVLLWFLLCLLVLVLHCCSSLFPCISLFPDWIVNCRSFFFLLFFRMCVSFLLVFISSHWLTVIYVLCCSHSLDISILAVEYRTVINHSMSQKIASIWLSISHFIPFSCVCVCRYIFFDFLLANHSIP